VYYYFSFFLHFTLRSGLGTVEDNFIIMNKAHMGI
jgi:hypothetical protein